MEEVLDKTNLSADVRAAGLDRISMNWLDVPWEQLFRTSKSVTVFISYGSSWRKLHWPKIEEFAKVKGNSLRLFLPDPDDDATMGVLARRYDYSSQKVRDNVLETAEEFAELGTRTTCQADIRIYYRAGDPTYTCYTFDDIAVTTLYANRRRRGDVPMMLFRHGSFRDFFDEDLRAIADQSRSVPLANVTRRGQ